MEQIKLKSYVMKTNDSPEEWRVEAIDQPEGDIYQAIFIGPMSRERAEEYAREKHGEDVTVSS